MNINQQEASVFVILGMSLAFFSTLVARQLIKLYETAKIEYEYMKHPRLIPHDPNRMCVDPHRWCDVKLALRGLPFDQYKVCTACGCIMGQSELMVSDEVLEQIAERVKILEQKAEAEKLVQERITDLTNSYIDLYIRKNFEGQLNDVHQCERLKGLAKYAVTALADASEKVASELLAQDELEDRYKDWSSKVKGNA